MYVFAFVLLLLLLLMLLLLFLLLLSRLLLLLKFVCASDGGRESGERVWQRVVRAVEFNYQNSVI